MKGNVLVMKCLRSLFGVSRMDRVRNEEMHSVTNLKKQATLKWRWRIDVDAGLVFILNIDTRSQFQEKRKVVRGEKGS